MASSQTLISDLKARGERITVQRRLVLDVLARDDAHLPVQTIQQRIAAAGTDLSETTVYRILQWLKDLGVVSQTDLGHSGVVYQLIGSPRHHHLVCLNCGAVIDLPDDVLDPLRATLRRDYAFESRMDHMAIYGICLHCADAAAVDEG